MSYFKRILLIFLLIFIKGYSFADTLPFLSNNELNKKYSEAIYVSNTNSNLSINILTECSTAYEKIKDTANLIKCLITIAEIQRINLNFNESYDNAWQALVLAEQVRNEDYLEKIYENIGILYSMFGQEKKAETYLLKSLEYGKTQYNGDNTTSQNLVSRYFNLVMLYNRFLKTDLSKKYLDSCFMISDKMQQDSIKRGYLYTEMANMHLINKDFKNAEVLLLKIQSLFEGIENENLTYKNDKGYLVIIYSLLGDVYSWMGMPDKSATYYEKSLNAIGKYNSQIISTADILYNLSFTYLEDNDYKKAHSTLLQSKLINDSIFGTKSSRNSELFEIKNKYREVIEEKNQEILHKNELIYEKENRLYKTKTIAFGSIALLIILLLFLQNRAQRRKHKLKVESDNEIIRIKNKELTSFTLQFIEKEEKITELSKLIKEKLPDHNISINLFASAKKSRNDYWDEFNTRFISVNQKFYATLSEKYPELTSTDLKHCALIKLNFSAKEMAQLLGISDTSVHTTHYRIRKKMSLERNVNLGNFISSI